MKLLGAVLIIVGCSGVGFSMCRYHRQRERAMEQLLRCLEWMILELNERMPPLNILCRDAADGSSGIVGQVMKRLAQELEAQLTPNVSSCMGAALQAFPELSEELNTRFQELGNCLGQFDLEGQITALEAVAARCRRDVEELGRNRQLRLRNYQTLGICAGVALVILFL